ncbi:MAG: MnmC family methyltransferase [Hydrogenovibrio sp.]|uniref:spermine/spermidine synthase domain-containing protein n=1 Tax=Hydrogenovibrio sp. TaxID=2065821 RepID=UPI002870275C|nr:MnmC family methyltransferase [Hydrogenovibrio sp.]MDR9498341.1 MnmC family methyltransferase [Hydrogenovibrio sp.]
MTQLHKLATAMIPNNGGELVLLQREDEFTIKLSGSRGVLMSSRVYNSEQELAKLGCAHIKNKDSAEVLVGGLGMGYTLATALACVTASSRVTVAELIPEVVEWNRGPLGECAGNPLEDARSHVRLGDIAELITQQKPDFDAILLDVDNGPEGMTNSENNWLYSSAGLSALYNSLRPEGMLAVWSAGPDSKFMTQLKKAGFKVTDKMVRARPGKGSRHTIFLAKKP